MFGQKNQSFRTTDLLMLISTVGVVSTVFGVVLAQTFEDRSPERARLTATALAREIQARFVTRPVSRAGESQRGPASEVDQMQPILSSGQIGKDPWGQPYNYYVSTAETSGSGQRVFVWSAGPNGQSETDPTQPAIAQASISRGGGDDILQFESIAAHP